MIIYYTDSDESTLIGIYSSDRSTESIAKIVGKMLSTDFVEAESDEYDDVGDFEQDTVVMSVNDFTEDILDIISKDIKIYLV